jgi:beta-lactamase superfamily II metal-dependent hydrolase
MTQHALTGRTVRRPFPSLCLTVRAGVSVLALGAVPLTLPAQPDDSVFVRVVDVGPGLCTVTRIPGGRYLVYDAGHWTGQHCFRAVQELVEGSEIDLLILSHNDSDHLGDGARILQAFNVHHIIWTGDQRFDTGTWTSLNDAVAEEVRLAGATVRTLKSAPLTPGEQIRLGDAVITLVAGWGQWTAPGPTASERRNVISVVARLDFGDVSILYTGDTVGKRLNDADDACKDAEQIMAANHDSGIVSIRADVLIAPHHGGNNGSSDCFIQRVNPRFVVFSAGHDHQHPTAAAAQRYLARGVSLANIFRTDRGDDEPGTFEWKEGSVNGCSAPRGFGDIEIALPRTGVPGVRYVRSAGGC